MRSGARLRLGIASSAVLLGAADTYVVVLVLTSIMGDVGVSVDHLQQATPIISGFLLGYVVVLPLLGRLSDIYGRPKVFVTCLGLFAVGSLVTASAHTLPVVVAGRTAQGLGGGGLVPVTLAIVADGWPPGRRGVPLGVVGAVQELGSVLGPLYGAALVTVSTWRAVFWVNVPISAAIGAAFLWVSRDGRSLRRVEGDNERRQRADVVGVLLVVASSTALLLALVNPPVLAESDTWGQLWVPIVGGSAWATPLAAIAVAGGLAAALWWVVAPGVVRPLIPVRRIPHLARAVDWIGTALLGGALACVILAFAAADPGTQIVASNGVVTLPLGLGLAAAFIVRELRVPDPLIDLRMLRPPAAWGALVVNLGAGAALMTALVDVPIFARSTIAPDDQLTAALVLLRLLIGVPVGAVVGGIVCERLSYRVTAALGMACACVGLVAISTWNDGSLASRLGASDVELVACGFGFGLTIAPVNAAILGVVRDAFHGLASALVVVARMIGMLGGLSLLTAIGLHRFYDAQRDIPECPDGALRCPAYDRAVTDAIISELHVVFLGAAVCAAAAAILSLVLLRRPAHHDQEGDGATDVLPVSLGASA